MDEADSGAKPYLGGVQIITPTIKDTEAGDDLDRINRIYKKQNDNT